MIRFATLALLASAGSALAGGTSYDISGTSVGQADNTYMAMGESHIFVDLNSTFTLPDNGTPMAGMAGTCMGFMTVTIGQGAAGNGMCFWEDADGDQWFGPWTVTGITPERATAGFWTASGGTGKFAGVTGGGTFTSLTDPSNGMSKLDVTGAVTLN